MNTIYIPIFYEEGVSDANRDFHPMAIAISTNEDSTMFEFLGK